MKKVALDIITRVLDFDGKKWVDVERPRIWRANPDDRCRCGRH